jgi:hypothetical protein
MASRAQLMAFAVGLFVGAIFQFLPPEPRSRPPCDDLPAKLQTVPKGSDVACEEHQHRCGPLDANIQAFRKLAMSQTPVTDKVTTHSYHIMYGSFLSGLTHKPIKMLEVGLGCDMNYGPGASVKLWKQYLHPESTIWMAEKDAECVEKHKQEASMRGIHTVTGDQKDVGVLNKWVQETGGSFDVVIDDGGHTNLMIKRTFDAFWPTLKPGGLYFIEDLQMGRNSLKFHQDRLEDGTVMADVIEQWIEALIIGVRGNVRLPAGLQSIFCQREACVLFKAAAS